MGATPLFTVPFLLVANCGTNTVGKYDAKTGAVINALAPRTSVVEQFAQSGKRSVNNS